MCSVRSKHVVTIAQTIFWHVIKHDMAQSYVIRSNLTTELKMLNIRDVRSNIPADGCSKSKAGSSITLI